MTTRNFVLILTAIIAVILTLNYHFGPTQSATNEIPPTASVAANRALDSPFTPSPSSSPSTPASGGRAGRGRRRERVISRAERHFILTLSEEDFLSTPLDRMMARYNFNFNSCDNDFGNGLVNRWRDTRRQACASPPSSSSSSVVETHLVRQAGHAGDGDNIVILRNVAVNLVALPSFVCAVCRVLLYIYVPRVLLKIIQ